jgi:hypothetical protein
MRCKYCDALSSLRSSNCVCFKCEKLLESLVQAKSKILGDALPIS